MLFYFQTSNQLLRIKIADMYVVVVKSFIIELYDTRRLKGIISTT